MGKDKDLNPVTPREKWKIRKGKAWMALVQKQTSGNGNTTPQYTAIAKCLILDIPVPETGVVGETDKSLSMISLIHSSSCFFYRNTSLQNMNIS